MVMPIVLLVGIPIFLGIAYMQPFELPILELEKIPEHDVDTLYFILMLIWTLYLIKILLQIKKGKFKATQRY